MKRIITFWGLIIALLLSVTASPAQIRFGVKGGVNLANVAISDASSYSILILTRIALIAGQDSSSVRQP